jgi:hypothetical protein
MVGHCYVLKSSATRLRVHKMDQLKVKVLLWDLRMEGSPWPQQEPRLRQLRAAYLLHKRTLIMA